MRPRTRNWSMQSGRALVAAFCVAAVSLSAIAQTSELAGRVTRVIDGDTIEIRSEKVYVVRLEGVDCPERGQPFSAVARTFVERLALGQNSRVRVMSTDRHGRLVGRVTVGTKDLAVEIVSAGLGWHYTDFSTDRLLEGVERHARQARRGLWSDPSPTPPWVARRQGTPQTSPPRSSNRAPLAGPFHGNKQSLVYHAPACKNYSCKNCTAIFATEEDAHKAGFRPAGDCLRPTP
jgi:micrococcal nuclease